VSTIIHNNAESGEQLLGSETVKRKREHKKNGEAKSTVINIDTYAAQRETFDTIIKKQLVVNGLEFKKSHPT